MDDRSAEIHPARQQGETKYNCAGSMRAQQEHEASRRRAFGSKGVKMLTKDEMDLTRKHTLKLAKAPPSCEALTVKDVASLLKIHTRTVWRLAGMAESGIGNFPKPVRLGPKTVRWRVSDIEHYLDHLAGEGAA
jgi:predicted DNA-binding transcriptional regulator AlpA